MFPGGKRVLMALEEAASTGARCPTNPDLPPNGSKIVRELARDGFIKIEVSGKNWRRVTILRGPLAGKSTAPDPQGARVYREIGVDDLVNGKPFVRAGKIQP